MSATTWHLDEELATAYAAGRTGTVLSASIEQHLLGCADCRALLTPTVAPARLDAVWSTVEEAVTAPRRTLPEIGLLRLGLNSADARLVAATPTLRGAWFTGIVLVLALALLAAYSSEHGVAIFFALAPSLPVAGVAVAFGPASDPAHEIASATPYPAVRLLALRTAVVVAATFVPAVAAGVLLPGAPWLATAWLLPGLALMLAALVLSGRFELRRTAGALAGGWVLLVLPGLHPNGNPLLAAEVPVQLGSLVLAAVCATLIAGHGRDLPESIRRVS